MTLVLCLSLTWDPPEELRRMISAGHDRQTTFFGSDMVNTGARYRTHHQSILQGTRCGARWIPYLSQTTMSHRIPSVPA
jgi:hypothetical protein